jgi:ParB-like chromosome segregation protein Spo0J
MKKTAFDASRENVYMLDPHEVFIETDPSKPDYDSRVSLPLPATFVASIRTHGVIQPIVVRKDGDKAVCVAGRQRVRALRLVNETREPGTPARTIPARIRKGTSIDHQLVREVENSQRQDDSPVERARKAVVMLNAGIPVESLLIAFACDTRRQFDDLCALVDLAKPVQEAIVEWRLPVSAAAILGPMSHEQQVERLEGLVVAAPPEKKITVRDVRAATGKKVRPTGKELRAQLDIYAEMSSGTWRGEKVLKAEAERAALVEAVVKWCLGEGSEAKVRKLVREG